MSDRRTLTAQQIAVHLNGRILGDVEVIISAVEVTGRASATDLTFVGDVKKISRLKSSKTRLVLVPHAAEPVVDGIAGVTFILVDEPEVAFLQIAGLLMPQRSPSTTGISPTAIVAESACIGADTAIGHHVVIGEDVTIGQGCRIEHGAVIEDGCSLGNNVIIHPNCVLYPDLNIGNDVTIHATCVIGADGFGYRTVDGRHERLPHYGTVRICDDVEIGPGTTIDRAKVGETIIGTGTRIDNQVMIGHNCHIGPHNLIVAQVGFAGSVSTGSYVVCAGQVGVADHVHLGNGAIIGGKSGVTHDLRGGESYFGTPAIPAAEAAKSMTALRRLPEIRYTVKQLERDVAVVKQDTAALAADNSSSSTSTTDRENQAA